jgi:glutathione S-transferase
MYPGEYQLVGMELSLYTRKLEAQLRFQQVPWRLVFKTQDRQAELEARAGTHLIPLLQTPDKWLIHDTIAIGPMLSDRFRERSVIPETPLQRACCFILEDAFSHWLLRPCVHSRWCYPENVAWVGLRFGANVVLGKSIKETLTSEEKEQLAYFGSMAQEHFGTMVCEVNGAGPEQADAVRSDFRNMLDTLAAHLAENRFLLGNRPCLADFAIAGASKAHFITDPEPLSWLGNHRDMLFAYTEQFYNDEPIDLAPWLENDAVPDSLNVVLGYLQSSYYQSARANVRAVRKGEKYYEYDCGFGVTRARTQKHVNMARLHVQDELIRCGAADDARVQSFFAESQILEHYLD